MITKEKIELKEGNIPIQDELLNKYKNVKEIFNCESSKLYDTIIIEEKIKELNNIKFNFLSSKETKKIARNIFQKYHNKNIFINNGNNIWVTNSGIDESINKIFASETQRNLLQEHLIIFSKLGEIIEHATLVNQCNEIKGRKKIDLWNYYFDCLKINGIKYSFEFDVRTLDNGQNQYRVQRLEIKKTTSSTRDVNNKC